MNYLLLCFTLIVSVTGFALDDTDLAGFQLETKRLVLTPVKADNEKFFESLYEDPLVAYNFWNLNEKELAEERAAQEKEAAELKQQNARNDNNASGQDVTEIEEEEDDPKKPFVTSLGHKIPLNFIISLKPSGNNALMNNVGMVMLRCDPVEEYNNATKSPSYKYALSLAYIIAPQYRNNGYAFEATATLIDYMQNLQLTDFKVDHFEAFVYSDNPSSVKTLQKLGFEIQDTGTETNKDRTRGHYTMKLSPIQSPVKKAVGS
jgi:ribosomal protein S18 acetylase RimI-like enzyme